MAEAKTFPHDDSFPDNVNPTEENRKAHSDRIEKERKTAEKESAELGDEAKAEEPEAKTDRSTRQGKTVSG